MPTDFPPREPTATFNAPTPILSPSRTRMGEPESPKVASQSWFIIRLPRPAIAGLSDLLALDRHQGQIPDLVAHRFFQFQDRPVLRQVFLDGGEVRQVGIGEALRLHFRMR